MLTSTGNEQIDHLLCELIHTFEDAFPNRIRGYYLEGSYADQTALRTSDIDLIIVFKKLFSDEREQERAGQLASELSRQGQFEFDIGFLEEENCVNGVPPTLKLASTLLYGEKLPDKLPLISVAEWGRERTYAAYWLMTKAFGRPNVVTYPRDYPNPKVEFYGYTERKLRLATGQEVNSTRDLIRVIGWAGTALVAMKGKQIVPRKSECHIFYRKYVNDQWSSLFEEIYNRCRTEWRYLIPEEEGEREALRCICRRALQFENYFLGVYKHFLLAELVNPDAVTQAHALWVQSKLPFQDPQIAEAIRTLTTCNKYQSNCF